LWLKRKKTKKKSKKTKRKKSRKVSVTKKKTRKVKKAKKTKKSKRKKVKKRKSKSSRIKKVRKINFKSPKLAEDSDGKPIIKVSDSWDKHAYINKSKYQKKYKLSIKENEKFWAKGGEKNYLDKKIFKNKRC